MPRHDNTTLPWCDRCGTQTTLKVTVSDHKGEMRDHHVIGCRRCKIYTTPWLMLATAIKRWIGV